MRWTLLFHAANAAALRRAPCSRAQACIRAKMSPVRPSAGVRMAASWNPFGEGAGKTWLSKRLVKQVVEVASRTLSEDVGAFGLQNIPASILGKDENGFLPNFALKPIHGGQSSEYTLIEKNFPKFAWRMLSFVTIVCGSYGVETFNDTGNRNLTSERFLYINGMAMTKPLALQNTNDLANMFDAPVLCVHNPTNGFLRDLVECATGLADGEVYRTKYSEPVKALVKTLCELLKDPSVETVRVIAHSQGTIISSGAVEFLQKDPEVQDLISEKLHLYMFAHAGDMRKWEEKYKPRRVEFFRNESDFVAQIGRVPSDWKVGDTFIRDKFSGHLLGEHYLPGLNQGKYTNPSAKSELVERIKNPIF